MIKVYNNTEYGISDTLDFMVELLKKQKKIGFSGAVSYHQNGAAD